MGLFAKTNTEKLFGTKNPTQEQIADYEKKHMRAKGEKPAWDASPKSSSQEFESVQSIDGAFKNGKMKWTDEIYIQGKKFLFKKSHKKGLEDIFKGNSAGYIIYSTAADRKELKAMRIGEWAVFVFKPSNLSTLVGTGLGFISAARGKVLYEQVQDTIGMVAMLKLQLPSGVVALKGRVDTGAEMSSLHVDSKPKVIGDTVQFMNHNASGNIITAPLVSQMAVKSADGGVEYRPVIELDIELNGKRISKAQFNLNDRSNMKHQVLIGQNILEKSGFLVDPEAENDPQMESEEIEELIDLDESQIELILNGEIIDNKIITEDVITEK